MILSQNEVLKIIKKDAKTMTVRAIAKKYNIAHHANVFNWLNGTRINVQMLEHFTKELTKGNDL